MLLSLGFGAVALLLASIGVSDFSMRADIVNTSVIGMSGSISRAPFGGRLN